MYNHLLSKTYVAGGAINPYRILKWGASNGVVLQAAGATDLLVGVVNSVRALASGERTEMVRAGIAEVEYGGTVTRGQPLTSDASGRAVAATLDPVNPPNIIGIAEESGVVGDIRPVMLVPMPSFDAAGHTLVADAVITSAQLLALNATPRTVLAAPAAGKAIIPTLIEVYKPAGTAYAGIAAGEDLAFKYTDASGDILLTMETTGFLDQATAQTRVQLPVNTTIKPVAAAALVAHMLTGEITTGDSNLLIRTHYKLIDTVLT